MWDTDLRVARTFKLGGEPPRLICDVFNLINANTVLVRVNNIRRRRFNTLAQNLSPRIARVGLVVGF